MRLRMAGWLNFANGKHFHTLHSKIVRIVNKILTACRTNLLKLETTETYLHLKHTLRNCDDINCGRPDQVVITTFATCSILFSAIVVSSLPLNCLKSIIAVLHTINKYCPSTSLMVIHWYLHTYLFRCVCTFSVNIYSILLNQTLIINSV